MDNILKPLDSRDTFMHDLVLNSNISKYTKSFCFIFCLIALLFFGSFEVKASQTTVSGKKIPPTTASAQSGQNAKLTFCYQGNVSNSRLVVVDKTRQRIMVFRYLGNLDLEYEYACSTGSRKGHKQYEGDERTPVGIYFTTHRYKDNKITIFGDQAIHLNFPNPFDTNMGYSGNGIYIHGTNQKLKPRASNGCIVMQNKDLAVLAPLIKEQMTPVVVMERFTLAGLKQRIKACNYLAELEEDTLKTEPFAMKPKLALRNNHGSKLSAKLVSLESNLHNLKLSGNLTVKNTGLVLLGMLDQWILVANQTIKGPGRKKIKLTRRFYLNGEMPLKARKLQGHWVLANFRAANALADIAPKNQFKPKNVTPVKVASSNVKKAAQPQNQKKQIKQMISAWLKSWQRKNLKKYSTFYAADFRSGKMNKKAWIRHKRYLNKVYKVIRVRAKNLKITSKANNKAKVTFVQIYSSDWHKDRGFKELKLVSRKGKWLILNETWHKISRKTRSVKKSASQG